MESTGKRNRKKTVPFQYGVFPPFDPQNLAGSEESMMENGINCEENEQQRPSEDQGRFEERVTEMDDDLQVPMFELVTEGGSNPTESIGNLENTEELLMGMDLPLPIDSSCSLKSVVVETRKPEVLPPNSDLNVENLQDLLLEVEVPSPIETSTGLSMEVGASIRRVASPKYSSTKFLNKAVDQMKAKPIYGTVLSSVDYEEPALKVNPGSIPELNVSSVPENDDFKTASEYNCDKTVLNNYCRINEEGYFSKNLWIMLVANLKQQVQSLMSWKNPFHTVLATIMMIGIKFGSNYLDIIPILVALIPLLIIGAGFSKLVFGEKFFESRIPISNVDWNLPEVYIQYCWEAFNTMLSRSKSILLIEDPLNSFEVVIVCIVLELIIVYYALTISDMVLIGWIILLPFTYLRKKTSHLRIRERTTNVRNRLRDSSIFRRKIKSI